MPVQSGLMSSELEILAPSDVGGIRGGQPEDFG